MNTTKKLRIFLFSLLAIVGAASMALASTSENISGWAQSANIGWIKLNNCDSEGTCEGGATYGLNTTVPIVKTGTSAITGYAWSSNIGWIKFNDGTCPAGATPCSGATINWSTGKIIGWARACSVYAANCSGALADDAYRGGWDGYIALNPKNASGTAVEGLSVDTTTGAISGYAWGSDVLGWVQFDGKIKIEPIKTCPDGTTPLPTNPTTTSCSCPSGQSYNPSTNTCSCPAGSAQNGVGQCICSVGGQAPVNGQCPNQISCPSNQYPNNSNDACLCNNGGSTANNCILPPTSCPTGQKLDPSGNSCICTNGSAIPATGSCPKKTPKYIES